LLQSEYEVYPDMENAEVQVQITIPLDVAATDKSSPTTNSDTDCLTCNNYWLNEIKSQEDTARQIMTLCVLATGISITLVTGNINNINMLLNYTTNYIEAQFISTVPSFAIFELLSIALSYFTICMFLIFFSLFLFGFAIAGRSLKTEQITRSDHLAEIANKKHDYNKEAIYSVAISMWIAIILVSIFMMTAMKYQLETATIVLCAIIVLWYMIHKLFK
jgi:hypothetical protein